MFDFAVSQCNVAGSEMSDVHRNWALINHQGMKREKGAER